mmetsp:Transcript_27877/g.65807  ORF Transcript_27877/g.65807 Transcript_27877/m.65807 type:complete len:292 (+) Transcript_27877:173-1048(+)
MCGACNRRKKPRKPEEKPPQEADKEQPEVAAKPPVEKEQKAPSEEPVKPELGKEPEKRREDKEEEKPKPEAKEPEKRREDKEDEKPKPEVKEEERPKPKPKEAEVMAEEPPPKPERKAEEEEEEELVRAWRAVAELRSRASWPPASLVACGQDLSGAEMDVALHSLARATQGTEYSTEAPSLSAVFAPCDYHLCEWGSYVNRPFLQELLPGAEEEGFAVLAALAAWSAEPREGGNEGDRRRRLGAKARALLDLGRALWLREKAGWRKVELSACPGMAPCTGACGLLLLAVR